MRFKHIYVALHNLPNGIREPIFSRTGNVLLN